MNDVAIAERLVGVQHVHQFGFADADLRGRMFEQIRTFDRAGGLADGEKVNVMTDFGQTDSQVSDYGFGAAICGRRDRNPGRNN
ncbi:hypothetical protein GCM10027088_52140 [Nocardia goodfellowii]